MAGRQTTLEPNDLRCPVVTAVGASETKLLRSRGLLVTAALKAQAKEAF